jgi:hypothetical protein
MSSVKVPNKRYRIPKGQSKIIQINWQNRVHKMKKNKTKTQPCAICESKSCEFDPRSWQGVLDTTLCDKFVSDLQQVGGLLRFPPPIKLTATI